MDRGDRGFWWYREDDSDEMPYVIADWHEARQYHLNSHCESCGAVWAQRGGRPGWCPNCGSNATNRLIDDWDDLDDPWDPYDNDGDYDPDEIEERRITKF